MRHSLLFKFVTVITSGCKANSHSAEVIYSVAIFLFHNLQWMKIDFKRQAIYPNIFYPFLFISFCSHDFIADLTKYLPLTFAIHQGVSLATRIGLIFSIIWVAIFSDTISVNFYLSHSPFITNSLTSISSSPITSLSRKYKAPILVQLSNQKLEFSNFICHQISCSIFSLTLIIFLHTCDETILWPL